MRRNSIPTDVLNSWHQQYTAQDGESIDPQTAAIREVESDVLDPDQIEAQVLQHVSKAVVVDGFCAKCQHLLNHWPFLAGPDVGESAVGRRFSTYEVEAAARLGCKFCAFLLSRLKYESLLDTFRKVEARLRAVGDSGAASLSIQEFWGMAHTVQFLWVNFPGKVASHCNEQGAQTVAFQSHILLPTGERQTIRSASY